MNQQPAPPHALPADQGDAARAQRLWEVALGVASGGHDLNNWLTIAISNLEFAQLELGRPVEELELCRSALQGARELMRDILAGQPRRDVSCDVTQAVRGVLRMARSLWSERPNVVVETELPHGVRAAMALPELQRVVLNLLLNALDAVGDCGRVGVRVARADATVLVEVRNTGGPIEAWYHGESARPFVSSKPSGVGLGLPGSDMLARRAGGRLVVAQHPTGDTVVRLIVPSPT